MTTNADNSPAVESHFRSIFKTLTWRTVAWCLTCTVVWVATRKFELAATVGLADTLVKLGAYYAHERIWLKVSFGRRKKPEYDI